MHQQNRHQAPRAHYGPRNLIGAGYGRFGAARAYGKTLDAPRGRTTLPEAWSIVCPNRITERRIAAGMEHVTDLHRAIGKISYQRLVKMEIGRVLIRESEYELVADALGLHETDLKLPLLTHSETLEWSRRWGARTQVEEGGDEDSVVLAAYVRLLVERTGTARTAVCELFGAPNGCLSYIWYAEKPIDRWPDSTMGLVMALAKAETWDDVILTSRGYHADRVLDRHIADVIKPRVRYAPEDPDRKAPWTYETDPFRTRQAKRQVQTPLSAAPNPETGDERNIRLVKERRIARIRSRDDRTRIIRQAYADAVHKARHGDQEDLLERLFPDASIAQIRTITQDSELAASVIARVALSRAASDTLELRMAGEMLGISEQRVRQIATADNGRLSDFLPKTKLGFGGGLNS